MWARLSLAVLVWGCPLMAKAVLFDATGDPGYNTNAPAGPLEGSGWQFEGQFGSFLGTAVDPHFFLTAKHINGDTNTPFVFEGSNYYPIASFVDPNPDVDLRLWQVADRLPRYAPCYTGSNEVGASLMVIGRGTQRGSEIITAGVTNGWRWGTVDSVMRWGVNQVDSIRLAGDTPYLYATFTHGAGSNECHLSSGDSGGAAFIQVNGVWHLAGIHYSVDGAFNTTNISDGRFDASLHDEYGLYIEDGPQWTAVTNHVASGFYSSQVSAHYAWMASVIPDFDSNANGLPDWWEQQYSGLIHGLSATNDNDHDGFSNYQEWVARTDPTNAASAFRVDALQWSNGVAVLTFQGWSNRLYGVEAREVPLNTTNSWANMTPSPFAGTEGPTSWIDTDSPTSRAGRCYRLWVIGY